MIAPRKILWIMMYLDETQGTWSVAGDARVRGVFHTKRDALEVVDRSGMEFSTRKRYKPFRYIREIHQVKP